MKHGRNAHSPWWRLEWGQAAIVARIVQVLAWRRGHSWRCQHSCGSHSHAHQPVKRRSEQKFHLFVSTVEKGGFEERRAAGGGHVLKQYTHDGR